MKKNKTKISNEFEKREEITLKDIVENEQQEKTIVNMDKINTMSIGIASDHRGFKMKQNLTKYLTKKGYTVYDYGTDSTESADCPVFGFKLGEAIRDGKIIKGIAICGSGLEIGMACNKVKGVRCATVSSPNDAKWARRDSDANAISISGKMPLYRAKDIVDVFLKYPFNGAERYRRRIEMLNSYEG